MKCAINAQGKKTRGHEHGNKTLVAPRFFYIRNQIPIFDFTAAGIADLLTMMLMVLASIYGSET